MVDALTRELDRRNQQLEQASRMLEYLQALFRSVHQAGDALLCLDPDLRVVLASQGVESVLGYAPEELGQQPFRLLIPPTEGRDPVGELQATLQKAHGLEGFRAEAVRKDGSRVGIELNATLLQDNGRVLGTVCMFHDAQERVAYYANLAQRERMAALGLLAAGIAHEVGNPLSSISAVTQLLQMHCQDDPYARDRLELVIKDVSRLSRLVHELTQFARPQPRQVCSADVNQIVQSALSVMKYHPAARSVAIELSLCPSHPKALATPDGLLQVLLNLAVNAFDAMPDGGRLTVTTSTAGDAVLVSIADTGMGMSGEVKAHLFEPFFTTKPIGRGAGMGLAISLSFVRQWGGTIEVGSRESIGTTFTVRLPLDAGK